MRISNDELKAMLSKPDFARRNPDLDSNHTARKVAVLEPDIVDVSLGSASIQKTNRQSFLVRVISVRARLLDEDNSCEKFLVDQCRYAGYIPDDCASFTKIETNQRKCQEGEPEHVEIMIERIP